MSLIVACVSACIAPCMQGPAAEVEIEFEDVTLISTAEDTRTRERNIIWRPEGKEVRGSGSNEIGIRLDPKTRTSKCGTLLKMVLLSNCDVCADTVVFWSTEKGVRLFILTAPNIQAYTSQYYTCTVS